MTEGHQETEGDQETGWVERPGRQRASTKARGELQGRPGLQGAESEGGDTRWGWRDKAQVTRCTRSDLEFYSKCCGKPETVYTEH